MKKILVVLALLTGTSAFAAGGSEAKTTDMYAPKAGVSEVLGGLAIYTGKNEVNSSSTKLSGVALVAAYGYGFSDFAAFYVQQSYLSVEAENSTPPFASTTAKTKGLGGTKIGVKAVIDYAPAFFYYDVGYQMALLEKPKQEANGDVTAGNTRPVLSAQVGGGTSFESVGVGALLSLNLYQDGDFDRNGVTVKNKSGSGSAWKIYAQYQASFKLGFSYSEQLINSYDVTVNSVTTSNDKVFSRNYALYSIIPVTDSSEVMIDLINPQGSNPNVTYGVYVLAGTYRMTF